ncbi:unnamed protein product, partial [Allacma fusca]
MNFPIKSKPSPRNIAQREPQVSGKTGDPRHKPWLKDIFLQTNGKWRQALTLLQESSESKFVQ